MTMWPNQHSLHRWRWVIRLGLIVAGVAVALISPLFLLVVLVIGSFILYASLPYRLRGLLFTTLFSRDLSHHKKHDNDA